MKFSKGEVDMKRGLIYASLMMLIILGYVNWQAYRKSNYYVETTVLFAKVSNQCIADYYYDDLTEEGYVYSYLFPPSDCDYIEKKEYRFIIKMISSEEEVSTKNMTEFRNSGANAYIIVSVLLKNSGETIEDLTPQMNEKFQEERNRNYEYDPSSPSLPSKSGSLNKVNYQEYSPGRNAHAN
jgi:hypothetical protein